MAAVEAIGRDRRAADANIGDNDRWVIGPFGQLVRADDGQAARAAEEDLALGRHRPGADPKVIDRQAFGASNGLNGEGAGIDDGQAVVGAGPDATGGIGDQFVDIHVRQAFFEAEAVKLRPALGIPPGEDIDPAARTADPQPPAAVDQERGDIAAGQAGRIFRLRQDGFGLAG